MGRERRGIFAGAKMGFQHGGAENAEIKEGEIRIEGLKD